MTDARDLQHAGEPVRDPDLIALEGISLVFMNRHLALSLHFAGWGRSRYCLEYKAEDAGIPVIAVCPSFTSHTCSGCGWLLEKSLFFLVHH
jgi:putative transposase